MDGVFKAMAHPARRKILALLAEGPRSAGELAEGFTFSKPTLSEHLAKLLHAGLVEVERRGGLNLYSRNTSVIEDLLRSLLALHGGPIGEEVGNE